MENGGQEGGQEDPAGQAVQGRDGIRDRGGQAQGGQCGQGREAREEPREQSLTAEQQAQDGTRGLWRQGGQGRSSPSPPA